MAGGIDLGSRLPGGFCIPGNSVPPAIAVTAPAPVACGVGEEHSVWDGTKARYGRLIWHRCTSRSWKRLREVSPRTRENSYSPLRSLPPFTRTFGPPLWGGARFSHIPRRAGSRMRPSRTNGWGFQASRSRYPGQFRLKASYRSSLRDGQPVLIVQAVWQVFSGRLSLFSAQRTSGMIASQSWCPSSVSEYSTLGGISGNAFR